MNLYKDVMMASQPAPTSPDGSSNGKPPERCPRPLSSIRDPTQEVLTTPHHHQTFGLVIKVEDEEDPYVTDPGDPQRDVKAEKVDNHVRIKEEAMPLWISKDPGDTPRDVKAEEEEEHVRIKEEDITFQVDTRAESEDDDVTSASSDERPVPSLARASACSKRGTNLPPPSRTRICHPAARREDGEFRCSECSKGFPETAALLSHQRIHAAKQHACAECGKRFVRKASLLRHIKTHNGEEPFSCSECSKAFILQANLLSHMRTHADPGDSRASQTSIYAEKVAEGQMQNKYKDILPAFGTHNGDTRASQRSIQAEKVAEGHLQIKDKEIPPVINMQAIPDKFTSPYFLPQFIDLYRKESCLWKVKSKDYMNRAKRNNAYDKLVELCRSVNARADVAYVKSKIANLRTVFKKELNKISASQRSGAAGDDVYVPRLWYFESLRFLTDHEDAPMSQSSMERSSSDSLSPMTDADNPEEIAESQEQDCNFTSPAPPAPYPKKRKGQGDITAKFLQQALAALQETSDEYDDLCSMAAKKFRRMSEEQKHYAEILLLQLMNKGLNGELTPNTQIIDLANSYGPPVPPQTPQTQHPYWRISTPIERNRNTWCQ